MCTLLRSTQSARRNARQSMLKGANLKTRLGCGETWFLFCSRTWAQKGRPLRWCQVPRSKNSHLRGFSDPVSRKAAWIPRWARQDCSLISHGSTYIWTSPESSERKRDCRGWKCLAQHGWFLYDERERSLPQIPQIPHSPLTKHISNLRIPMDPPILSTCLVLISDEESSCSSKLAWLSFYLRLQKVPLVQK